MMSSYPIAGLTSKSYTCTFVCISYATNWIPHSPFSTCTPFLLYRQDSTIVIPDMAHQVANFFVPDIPSLFPLAQAKPRHVDPLDGSGEVALLCQPGVVFPPFAFAF